MANCVALLVLLSTICVVSGWHCNNKQYVNGCSIPFRLPFFYKRRFTPACNKHDVCYSCGSSRYVSRRGCDIRFLRNMRRTCSTRSCRYFANVYYKAVRKFGKRRYKQYSPRWCYQYWVGRCV